MLKKGVGLRLYSELCRIMSMRIYRAEVIDYATQITPKLARRAERRCKNRCQFFFPSN